MGWLIWSGLGAVLAVSFAAGTLPGEHWMDLVRGWDKVRFAAYRKDKALAVMGVIGTVIAQTLAGGFRLMALGMGASMVIADRVGERIGEWLPGYPKAKEIESGNDRRSHGGSEL